jgi:DGQHR domain-containing protein
LQLHGRLTDVQPRENLVIPALRTHQGDTTVYLMFLKGGDLLRIADIRRLARGQEQELQGFQRKEIREHVNEITHYLDNGGMLFPNAIILALEPGMHFASSRGTKGKVSSGDSSAGRLTIPVRAEGQRAAWIVDGQQRTLALAKSKNRALVVPLVAFETGSIQTQREQFILVNRAKPLPRRLIDELLPDTPGVLLPRDLTARQLPSQLCNLLNGHAASPLRGLIRRASEHAHPSRVVIDTAVLNMIRRSLNNPNGALAMYRSWDEQPSDTQAMFQVLTDFWAAVKDTFPQAWGKSPSESRLMHSAGIAALGELMDRITARANGRKRLRSFFSQELATVAKLCAWDRGRWPRIDRAWDEIESTPRDIKILSQVLVQLYAQQATR